MPWKSITRYGTPTATANGNFPFDLPISVDKLDVQEILRLTKSDKKMESGQIKFVLLKKIGKAVIDRTVTDEEIVAAINEINFSEEDAHA